MARASDNSIRKTARNAIKSQYTASGKPIADEKFPHDEVVSHDEVTDLREFTDIMIDNLNDVDRLQWESTKQLYALGRRNFLKYCTVITVLAVTSAVIGTTGLIMAVRGYAK